MEAEKKASARLKKNDLFVDFAHNPFSDEQGKYNNQKLRKIYTSKSSSKLSKKTNKNKIHDEK